MTTLGDIIYGAAAGATTRLAGPTVNGTYELSSIPTASVAVAPTWVLATGTGSPVRATTPTLVTPVLGVATATSINKVTITAPTTSATLTLVTGSSLITVGAFALTLTSTAATNATFPAGTNTLEAHIFTTLGDTDYGGAAGVSTRLAGPTVNGTYVLSEVVSASAAVAPTWTNLATYLAAPPAIGGTTPGAGTFTQVNTTTGSVIAGNNSFTGGNNFIANGVTGQSKNIAFQTAGVARWFTGANAVTESGSNAGSDYIIIGFNDAGSTLGTYFTIIRSTGSASFGTNSVSMGALTATTGTFSGGITASSVLTNTASSDPGQGGIFYNSGGGLTIHPKTGGSYDFQVTDTAFTVPIISIPTGTKNVVFNAAIQTGIYAVAGLPAGSQGMRAMVNNALAPTYGAAVVGGGAVVTPVFHDGTSWKVG